MKGFVTFVAGFASGWVVRSTVDSSRGATVGLIGVAFSVADRTKRFVALEREHLEDLVAEGRSRFEAKRARDAARKAPRAAPVASAPATTTSSVNAGPTASERGRAA